MSVERLDWVPRSVDRSPDIPRTLDTHGEDPGLVAEDEVVWDLAVHRHDAGTVLRVSGELDLDSAPALLAAAVELLDEGAAGLVIDLSGLTFVDSSGLGALVGCWRHAQRVEVPFMVVNPTDEVTMTLEITGLDQILPVSRDHAA